MADFQASVGASMNNPVCDSAVVQFREEQKSLRGLQKEKIRLGIHEQDEQSDSEQEQMCRMLQEDIKPSEAILCALKTCLEGMESKMGLKQQRFFSPSWQLKVKTKRMNERSFGLEIFQRFVHLQNGGCDGIKPAVCE